jgi:hypothetical protein
VVRPDVGFAGGLAQMGVLGAGGKWASKIAGVPGRVSLCRATSTRHVKPDMDDDDLRLGPAHPHHPTHQGMRKE